jgi:hypothetical protein
MIFSFNTFSVQKKIKNKKKMLRVIIVSPQNIELKKISKKDMDMLENLQNAVGGGNIELFPHPEGMDAPYVAYANEEGLIKGLPNNELATKTLARLGFIDFQQEWGRPVAGNIVILGKGEKSLSKKQEIEIKKIVDEILKK